jgi:hypothetical protein
MSRRDQWKVQVNINQPDGTPWPGLPRDMIFDAMTGGGMGSTSTKYRPGNMGQQMSLGGTKDIANATCSRLMASDRDWPLFDTWADAAGVANAIITRWPLNARGVINGPGIQWRGTLITATPPDVDSNSQDPAIFTIEVETEGSPSQVAG